MIKNRHELLGALKQAEQSNEYDYNKMMKDFKFGERYQNAIRKTRNKWKSENKKYLIRLEQMKEKKEESYKAKRNNFINEYLRRQKDIEKQLYRTRISKQGDWKKNSLKMEKKNEQAKEKQRKKIERDEKYRLNIESQISSKSKKKIIKYI